MPSIAIKTCEIMQYFKFYDCNEIAVVEQRIKELSNLKSYCIIVHDKDILPNGELKPPHFHAVVTFSNSTTIEAVAKKLCVEPQFVNKIKTTTKSAQLYLVHRNNPEKFQYEPNEVHANFDYVNMVDDCPVKEKRENIAQRIATGEIKEYNLFKYVTIDEYAKNKRYYNNCFEYRQQAIKGLDRKMECIFIYGASGTGKTTYSKTLASQKGYHCYISSGGKNPLDNYKGEECIILDDTRSSTWSLTDFLKLTDNHTDSLVGCRFYNKSIAECKLIIVTSVKSLDGFYEQVTKEDNEPKIQLYRRFKQVFHMEEEFMTVYSYVESEKKHIKLFRAKNPVAIMFNPVVARKTALEVAKSLGLEITDDTQILTNFEAITDDEPLPFDDDED